MSHFTQEKRKSWIVSVNMGYGHQRAAYPLRILAPEMEIINSNDYKEIPVRDKRIWETSRKFYEFISNFRKIPIVGKIAFNAFDAFQKIRDFYPKRDLSKPNSQLRKTFVSIKKGWGEDLIERLKKSPLPIIATFFTPAHMAEYFHYPNNIYCVVCDADISRTWAPLRPSQSTIKYFAPNQRVVNRLKLYGVIEKNIFLTGFPLPLENIGSEKLELLTEDLKNRIINLDPKKSYAKKYKVLINEHLGILPKETDHSLTIMFAVGGAGAQKEIGIKIIKSLKQKIRENGIRIYLSVGIRKEVKEYFIKNIKALGIKDEPGNNIKIVFAEKIEDYFKMFNNTLRKTDILWTKPSELSFYTALGLPIIIAPTIGSQEKFNKEWLLKLGSGVVQEDPRYTNQWLFDFLNSGRLAEAAMQGFIEAEKLGVLNIQKIISNNP